MLHAGKIKAYIQLCLAISAQALNTKAASPTRPVTDNPKYTFDRPFGPADWVPEEGVIPVTEGEFDEVKLEAHKVATTIRVSDELLEDCGFNLEDFLASQFASRIASAEEHAFLYGDGKAKPLGLLHRTGYCAHPVRRFQPGADHRSGEGEAAGAEGSCASRHGGVQHECLYGRQVDGPAGGERSEDQSLRH